MFRYSMGWIFLSAALLAGIGVAQETGNRDKSLDVRSPAGDLHVGPDADAKSLGLPIYPGARPQRDKDNDPLNFGVVTDAFGMHLVVAKYQSDDPPEKILAFYREKMKKYGKVLECHGTGDASDVHSDDDHPSSKPLKCEGDNTGPVRELKVGTEDNAHIVALENAESNKSTSFALVYLHTRGKRGDI